MEERSREDVESVDDEGGTVMEKGRQHGKQLRYRELCNQSRNGKKGGRQAMPPCSVANWSRIPPRMVRGGGDKKRTRKR